MVKIDAPIRLEFLLPLGVEEKGMYLDLDLHLESIEAVRKILRTPMQTVIRRTPTLTPMPTVTILILKATKFIWLNILLLLPVKKQV